MDAFQSDKFGDPKRDRDFNESGPSHSAVDKTQMQTVSDRLLACCKETIRMHAANNPMMVCSDCKQIIKCFDEERPFKNYQRFCASRHRKILVTTYDNRFVVVFRSYDMYST